MPNLIHLEGTIDSIIYYNANTQYCVARFFEETARRLHTVIGGMIELPKGTMLRLAGNWTESKTYGRQFKIESYIVITPKTTAGIERLLSSGSIKGIGPSTAKRIVKYFGKDTLRVLEESPARLKEVKGFGKKRLAQFITEWKTYESIKSLMLFCHEHELTSNLAAKLHKTYGPQAMHMVRSNPFQLAIDVGGIGFKKADDIAAATGLPKDAPTRLRAGLLHLLHESRTSGHLYLPKQDLVHMAENLLAIDEGQIANELQRLLQQEGVVAAVDGEENPVVYLTSLYEAEVGVAQKITRLLGSPSRFVIASDQALIWLSRHGKIQLSNSQQKAISSTLSSKITIITGGPGTGKTTIIRELAQVFRQKGAEIFFTAPTGRAANRLAEATGFPAKTIHRLLEYSPKSHRFNKNESDWLACDVLIVDEASMIDTPLFYALVSAIPPSSKLVIVGDVDQLPSIGPGNTLRELIGSQEIPTIYLTEIYRQKQGSTIVDIAHQIKRGEIPTFNTHQRECRFVPKNTPEEIISYLEKTIVAMAGDPGREHELFNLQILVPMNRGLTGIHQLNPLLQKWINKNAGHGPSMSLGANSFYLHDRVIQLVNNYDKDVFNGDIGFVEKIDPAASTLKVRFYHQTIEYKNEEIFELSLAYAITIHKSQGSEYKNVLILLANEHYILLQRNLLYTAITRAKERAYIVGTAKALRIAVSRTDVANRNTLLANRIKQLNQ
jgi:exodeoxyribonuclease V alpha subunit